MKIKLLLCLTLIYLGALNLVNAQVPTISSFSPVSGEIGTSVTISGVNFDIVPENNTVYFGGVKAEIISASTSELVVKVPSGAGSTPISVLTGGLIAYSSKAFSVTFNSDGLISNSSSTFVTSHSIETTSAWIVASGDLDGDNKIDLVVGNFDDNDYSVYKNTTPNIGNITFADSVNFSTSGGANEIELADFDGDGKLDIAVVSENESSGTYYLQVDRNTSTGLGAFSFITEQLTTLDSRAWSLSFGDFNNDGKVDLVVEDADNNEISIFKNTSTVGAISFANHTDFSVGNSPSAVTVADINNDGLPEILTVNETDKSISVLKNTSSDNSISFAPKIDLALNTTSVPQWMVATDLDGDGLPDLAIQTPTSVIIVRNQSTTEITLATPSSIDTSVYYGMITANDFNGDGKSDLLLNTSFTTIGILPNNTTLEGSITFSDVVSYSLLPNSHSPMSAISTDLDGDGEPDLVVISSFALGFKYMIDIIRNKQSGADITSFSFPQATSPAIINSESKTIKINVNEFANISNLTATFTMSHLAQATISTVTQTSEATSNDFTNPVVYSILAEDGTTTNDWTVTVTQDCAKDRITQVKEACGSYDFDGDVLMNSGRYVKSYINTVGCDSIVTLELTIHPTTYHENIYTTGSYSIDGETLITSGQYSYGPFTSSLGCDSTYVLNLTIEPDTYDSQTYLQFQPAGATFKGLKGANYIGDIDGDNDLDIILLGATSYLKSKSTRVYLNEGDGSFVEKENHGFTDVFSVTNTSKLIDIDKDNDLDFLLYGFSDRAPDIPIAELYINDGTGNFTKKLDANIPLSHNGAIDIADVDNDKDLDLFVIGKGQELESNLWLNDGNEVFSPAALEVEVPVLLQGSVNFGDVDGDGDQDVFITGQDDNASRYVTELYLNDGSGNYQRPINQSFLGIYYSTVKMVDLDNDGDLDIFASGDARDNEQNTDAIIYFNDGSGNFTKDVSSNIPEIIAGQAVFTDLDRDGDADLLLSGIIDNDEMHLDEYMTGIYLNNGLGHFKEIDVCSVSDYGFSSLSVGDFDGDDRTDFLINGYKTSSGIASSEIYFNKEILSDINVTACENYEFNDENLTVTGTYQRSYTDEYGCSYPVNLHLTILQQPDVTVTQTGATLFATEDELYTYQWLDCDNDYEPIEGGTQRQFTPGKTGNFAVEVSNGSCTVVRSNCFYFDITTGLEVNEISNIEVYPTLTKDWVTIDSPQEMGNVSLMVMSLSGQVILSQQLRVGKRHKVQLKGANGVYLLQLTNKNQLLIRQKILKAN